MDTEKLRQSDASGQRQVYYLSKASIRSSSSEEDLGQPKRSTRIMSYRMSEGGESQVSARPPVSRASSITMSTERNIMKDQLHHVKQQLNALAGGIAVSPASLMAPAPLHAQQPQAVLPVPALEKLLHDIASRLCSIENMYDGMSSKLLRVDQLANRAAETERTVRELQHISAGAINETARLVDIVGTGHTRGGNTPGIASQHQSNTLTTPQSLPRASRGMGRQSMTSPLVEGLATNQVAGTIQQHTSQINKLVAGLDFLEQHIIRQDQAVEALQQQQRIMVSHGGSIAGSQPNEIAVKLHDLSELVNKLRSHMYKVEKKAGAGDANLTALTAQLEQVKSRLDAVEQSGPAIGSQTPGAITNPLFSSPEEVPRREVRASIAEVAALADSHAELRKTVTVLAQELQQLRQQPASQQEDSAAVSELRAELADMRSAMAVIREEAAVARNQHANAAASRAADLDASLMELQARQSAAAQAAEETHAEVASLRHRLADSIASLEAQLQASVTATRSSRTNSLARDAEHSTELDVPAVLDQVQVNMELIANKLSTLGERVVALDATTEATKARQESGNAHLNELEKLLERMEQEAAAHRKAAQEENYNTANAVASEVLQAQARIAAVAESMKGMNQKLEKLSADVAAEKESQQENPLASVSQLAALQSQVDQLAAEYAAWTTERVDTITQLAGAQQQLAQKIVTLEQRHEHWQATVQHVADELETAKQAWMQGLSDAVSQSQEAQQQIQAHATSLTEEVAQLSTNILEANKAVRTISQQVVELAGRIDTDIQPQVEQLANSSQKTEEIYQAVAALQEELQTVKFDMVSCNQQLDALSNNEQLNALAEHVTVAQADAADATQGVTSIRELLARDYINHEKLSAIFAAREDMRAAVSKLEGVFSSGKILSPQVSKEVVKQLEDVGDSLHRAGIASPRLSAQLEDLSSRLIELQAQVAEQELQVAQVSSQVVQLDSKSSNLQEKVSGLQAHVGDLGVHIPELQQQVQLALYRTGSMVRQEDLGSLKQGMVALELQFKEQNKRAASVASTQVLSERKSEELRVDTESSVGAEATNGAAILTRDVSLKSHGIANFEDTATRVHVLEQQVAALRNFATGVEAVVSEDVPDLRKSVQDLQLMFFDLRGKHTDTISPRPTTKGAFPSAEDASQTAQTIDASGPQLYTVDTTNVSAIVSQTSYHSFAEPDGSLRTMPSENEAIPSTQYVDSVKAAVHAPLTQEPTAELTKLSQRIEQLQELVLPRIDALENAVHAIITTPTDKQQTEDGTVDVNKQLYALQLAVQSLEQQVVQSANTHAGNDHSRDSSSDGQDSALLLDVAALQMEVSELRSTMAQLKAGAGVAQQAQDTGFALPTLNVRVDNEESKVSEAVSDALSALSTRLLALEGKVFYQQETDTNNQAELANQPSGSPRAGPAHRLSIRSQPADSYGSLSAFNLEATGRAAKSAGPGSVSSPTHASLTAQASGFVPGSVGGTGSGQARFISKLLEVVKRQATRLHSQYAEEEEVEGQLHQVEQQLAVAQQQLESPPDQSAADAYAEAMVLILDQVAALRTIGSQTHPAIQQMILSHDNQIQELQGQVGGVEGSAAVAASLQQLEQRIARVEQNCIRLSDGQVTLGKAMGMVGQTTEASEQSLLSQDVSQIDTLRAVAARVVQLEEMVNALGSQPVAANGATTAINLESGLSLQVQVSSALRDGDVVGGGSGDAATLAVLEGKLVDYDRILKAMRNRIVVLQEYIDSTQGMVKELHTVHGSVLMRLSALERSEQLTGDADSLHQVQADIQSLECKFLAFSHSQAQLSTSLEALRQVGDKMAELDAKDGEMDKKLASIGQTMPVLASQLKALERSLQMRLDACCSQLQGLGAVLSEISRLEKQDTKNPFANIAGGAGNPVVKLLETKVEMLRGALSNVAQALSTEFSKTQQNL